VPFCTDKPIRQRLHWSAFQHLYLLRSRGRLPGFSFSRKLEGGRLSWRAIRFEHVVLKGHAFGILFLEPGFRGVGIREDLEMIAVSDLLAVLT
jgi:hypothetical protein